MDFNYIYGIQTLSLYGLQDAIEKSQNKNIWKEIAKELGVTIEQAPYALVGIDKEAIDMIWNSGNAISTMLLVKYTIATCDLVVCALSDKSDKYNKLKKLKEKYFGNLDALKDSSEYSNELEKERLIQYTSEQDVYISEDGTIFLPDYITDVLLDYILGFLKIVFLGDDYKPILLKTFLKLNAISELQEADLYTNEDLRRKALTCAALINIGLTSVTPIEIDPEVLIKYDCISIYIDVTHRILMYKDPESDTIIQELYNTSTLQNLVNSGEFANLSVKDAKLLFDGKSYSGGSS